MGNVDGFDTSRLLKKSIRGLFDADLSSLRSPGFARKPGFAFPGEPAQREEGPPDLPLDPLRPWPSPYGRYQVAPNFSPGEIVSTKNEKWPLLRILRSRHSCILHSTIFVFLHFSI